MLILCNYTTWTCVSEWAYKSEAFFILTNNISLQIVGQYRKKSCKLIGLVEVDTWNWKSIDIGESIGTVGVNKFVVYISRKTATRT